ncbi:hypothetical protein JAAARDRAFT_38018 [Jaapia argillacea MUCL 33604]|uniref:Poly A polymerase head domain-containing protein n=1 Tax=Jaapia argillacea MUCL 33604 TaxID=933084 RepID=A0A067PJ20_9AGAM|nr:hypothetical protein JAAARDRAFT_38018 [Jaapia argillacea MUCL 33604]
MTRNVSLKHITYSRVVVPDAMTVTLTSEEDQLCSLLHEYTEYLRQEKGEEICCRVAGGWVRDKLLGSQSNDVDIALSNMMGVPFTEGLVSYASERKHIAVHSVTKVEINPEQSKHLETAKTEMLGIELEIVNLRDEEYSENSRIPSGIKFGTPLEDAQRRDLTINALFYNIHSREVEDHTEKGLDDLKNGIVRTPLPPRQTFMDDPLRVIRCVRFASRYGFDMVSELEEAARDPQIQLAITSKISRERVGEEIDKMMKGRDPLRSIQLIDSLSLYASIFWLPTSTSSTLVNAPLPYSTALAASAILQAILNPGSSRSSSVPLPPVHPLFTSLLASDPSTLARLYLAAALTPYRGLAYNDSKGKQRSVVEASIREGLKLGTKNHYMDGIPALFAAADLVKGAELEYFRAPSERAAIGLLLRDKYLHNPHTGSHWTTSLLFSLVQDLVSLWDHKSDEFDLAKATAVVERYNSFMTRIEELDLPPAVDAKSILDGNEVVRELGASKPGPWTGHAIARVVEWQLENPEGTKEECTVWLKSEQLAGRIQVDDGKRGKEAGEGKRSKKLKR